MNQLLIIAIVVGILQGVFEWLPISSEGNITLVLTALFAVPATEAVQFSLFLHLGTALSAAVYYRETVSDTLSGLSTWRPASAFEEDAAELSFITIATLVSGIVGILVYATLETVVSEVAGGTFVVLIGVLLICTGVFQRVAQGRLGGRTTPEPLDAILVGTLQGTAILPGVSRSGSTAGALLLRGYDGEAAFRLSFLLSIPAALGAGLLIILDVGGVPAIAPRAALLAVGVSAIVGYLTIDGLMRLVKRVSFWTVCLGLGVLAVFGGLLLFI